MEEIFEKQNDEKLGAYLARVRNARKMSKEDLAKSSGVNIRYLESIEEGAWKKFPVEAYLRSYVNSVSVKLGLDSKQVLAYLSSEIGSNYSHEFDAIEEARDFVNLDKNKKGSKGKLVIIVVLLLVILAALAFVLKLSEGSSNVQVPHFTSVPVEADSLEAVLAEPEGAISVKVDSTEEAEAKRTVDSLAAEKDLPASATVFISSDSKEEVIEQPAKNVLSEITLFATGTDSTWIGIKKSRQTEIYSKQGKFIKETDKLSYSSKDTLYVLIGNPAAVSSMKINNASVKLPTGVSGRALRFRVLNGRLLNGF